MAESHVRSMVVEVPSATDGPPLSDEVDLVLGQRLRVTLDESGNQLSKPQTNRPSELCIPRNIISSSVSSAIFHAEFLRPIIAGTYHDVPAYLVILQFQLAIPGNSRSWSRIQRADISVLVKDAPCDPAEEESDDDDDEPSHPSIVKTFPGPEGWKGALSTAEVTESSEVGLQLGLDSVSASVKGGRTRTKTETGAVSVIVVRRQSNSLQVTVTEDSVDRAGVPQYLRIPVILTHQARRFSMRVVVKARFGFWRGKLAETVPVLGRADEPLYFDPLEMHQMAERGQKGKRDGVQLVERRGELEDINLREHCSLTDMSGQN